jgi:proton-translocating NADH-quinone oxidoreductase chain L
MRILILFFPLFGFLSGILFGRFLGKGVSLCTTFLVFISFLISSFSLYNNIQTGDSIKIILGSWISSDSLNVEWSFLFDSLTNIMLVVVTFISCLVHLYSTEYMNEDPHLTRFMSFLSLFTFFMLILVTANNFLQMFVGWEGVGLSSFLLINFWFTRIQANKSAIKAMLVNRVGDFFLLLAIFLIYFFCNSLDYDVVFNMSKTIIDYKLNLSVFNFTALDLICLFLFLGAMGKSAQIGLHVWLPDAMEGPTPVSALIHAATMVTAGVFLIARCSFLFELSPFVLNFVILIGAMTAFFASTTGLFQNDIKKVIAYSTCSQLGYMVFACGLSSYEVGIFHLFNHAFFKALLFLGAGSIIHAVSNEQDMRKMGGLKNLLPFSYAMTLIGSLALIGFPFLSGFYSKDTVLEIAFSKYSTFSHFSFFLGTFAAFFTAFYSTRLIFLVFLNNTNGNKTVILNAHEGAWRMSLPLLLLSFFSIFIGFLAKDLFIGFGTDFWNDSIYVLPENYILCDVEFMHISYKLMPLIFTMFGIFGATILHGFNLEYYLNLKKNSTFKAFYNFFNKKWYFDRFYNETISQNFLFYSYYFSYKDIDRGFLEIFGPFKLTKTIDLSVFFIKNLQSGNIFHYLFIFLIVILLTIFTYLIVL